MASLTLPLSQCTPLTGKGTALLVGGSRDRSLVVSLGIFFSIGTDETMCPGVDSASKNEY
jgi:hypothetical protein